MNGSRFTLTLRKGLLTGLIVVLILVAYLSGHQLDLLLALTGLLVVAYSSVVNARSLWIVLLVCLPFSLEIDILPGNALTLPTDLLALTLSFILIIKVLRGSLPEARLWLTHPSVIALLGWLSWLGIAAFVSSEPTVSWKYVAMQGWQVGGVFFASLFVFREPLKRTGWLRVSLPTVVFLVVITLFRHAITGFAYEDASRAMRPFFRDHGAYATYLAVLAVWAGVFAVNRPKRIVWALFSGLLIFAVLVSYTRGAWLGLAVAYLLLGLIWLLRRFPLRGRITTFATLIIVGGYCLFTLTNFGPEQVVHSQSPLYGFQAHLSTISQTESNASNRERINRWACALDMIHERPWFGFGPGTFPDEYAPFQQSRYKTYISTNRGTLGGSHQEFLGAGAEAGLPALILLSLFYSTVLYCGISGFWREPKGTRRMLYAAAAGGFLSYTVHAFLNSFMDQDKVAVPVYICAAVIVALDVYPKTSSQHHSTHSADDLSVP